MNKLFDYLDFKNGKEIKKKLYREDGNVKIYGSNGLLGFTDNYLIDYDCIVIGRVGACGSVHLITDEYSWVTDNAIIATPKNRDSLKYIYYLLKSLNLATLKKGSVQPMLTQSSIGDINISLPELPTQMKIADLLSSLDDKIEINNKINQELEELGKALYTKWFVNFDFPNKEGKPYKSSGGEMIESELGMIPKSWKVGSISDISNLIWGQCPNSKDYEDFKTESNYYYASGAGDMEKNNIIVQPKRYSRISKRTVNKGDLLLSIVGTIGEVKYVDKQISIGRATLGFELKEEEYRWYLYLSLYRYKDKFNQLAEGSIQKVLNNNHISIIKLPIPPINISNKALFNTLDDIFNLIILNNTENKKLEELRDFLIPQLMSGNLEIKDIEY